MDRRTFLFGSIAACANAQHPQMTYARAKGLVAQVRREPHLRIKTDAPDVPDEWNAIYTIPRAWSACAAYHGESSSPLIPNGAGRSPFDPAHLYIMATSTSPEGRGRKEQRIEYAVVRSRDQRLLSGGVMQAAVLEMYEGVPQGTILHESTHRFSRG